MRTICCFKITSTENSRNHITHKMRSNETKEIQPKNKRWTLGFHYRLKTKSSLKIIKVSKVSARRNRSGSRHVRVGKVSISDIDLIAMKSPIRLNMSAHSGYQMHRNRDSCPM